MYWIQTLISNGCLDIGIFHQWHLWTIISLFPEMIILTMAQKLVPLTIFRQYLVERFKTKTKRPTTTVSYDPKSFKIDRSPEHEAH